MTSIPVYLDDYLNTTVSANVANNVIEFLTQIKTRLALPNVRVDIYLHTSQDNLRGMSAGSFYPDSFRPELFSNSNVEAIMTVKLYSSVGRWEPDARPT